MSATGRPTGLDRPTTGARPRRPEPGVVLDLISKKAISSKKVRGFLDRKCRLKELLNTGKEMRY